jgi:hypothetical protein
MADLGSPAHDPPMTPIGNIEIVFPVNGHSRYCAFPIGPHGFGVDRGHQEHFALHGKLARDVRLRVVPKRRVGENRPPETRHPTCPILPMSRL